MLRFVLLGLVIFEFYIQRKFSEAQKHIIKHKQKRTTYPAAHHDYQAMTDELNSIVQTCPDLTKLYSIGKSVEGRQIWVLEVTENPGVHIQMKPEFKYIANMHGNEVVGKELLLILARYLCKSFSTIPSIRFLLQNTRIHLLPSMNPDGYEKSYSEGGQDWLRGRNNANDVDLNRNFPDQYFPIRTELQPETLAVMKWTLSLPFVLSGNLHGGSLVVNYPFDDNPQNSQRYSPTPDDDIFRHLASVYSETHPTMHSDNPLWECPDIPQDFFSKGITNGAAWYSVIGSLQDWTYLQSSCFDVTLEIGCRKFPRFEELPKFWDHNREALIALIAETQRGVKGLIMDEEQEKIKNAEILVVGRRHISYSSEYGDYFRILLPGVYNITVGKPGYDSETKMVEITDNLSKVVHFTLKKNPNSNAIPYSKINHHLKSSERNSVENVRSINKRMREFKEKYQRYFPGRNSRIARNYDTSDVFQHFIDERDEA